MKGIKTQLLGIGIALMGIAFSTHNMAAFGASAVGFVIMILGFFQNDKGE